MPDLRQEAFWPGLENIESCTYTISQGVGPGIALLVARPQFDQPSPGLVGDLIVGDGQSRIAIVQMRLKSLKVTLGDDGTRWHIELEDRRWKWRDCGFVNGLYNVRDEHSYLLLWTARTPEQLAEICLIGMGETSYTIRMPRDYFPAVTWDFTNAAHALDSLAQEHGCVVAYNHLTDSVLVTKNGLGANLPDGFLTRAGPSLKAKGRPTSIVLIGAPIRYQVRMPLEAVGEEWNGWYVPTRFLTYAPAAVDAFQVNDLLPKAGVQVGNTFVITIDEARYSFTCIDDDETHLVEGLIAAINANPFATVKATGVNGVGGVHLILTAFQANTAVEVLLSGIKVGGNAPPDWKAVEVPAGDTNNPWAYSAPPLFVSARETDRLSHLQAMDLASKSVWKCYRISGLDSDGLGTLNVPGFGRIVRREQILLSSARVEQIDPKFPKDIPIPRDRLRAEAEYYNGWSRDQKAQVFGSYNRAEKAGENTPYFLANSLASEQVLIRFEVDQKNMLIRFQEHVYAANIATSPTDNQPRPTNGRVGPALLWLDCAINVRNPVTNDLIRYTKSYFFPGESYNTRPKVIRRPDVQFNYIGNYNSAHQLISLGIDNTDYLGRSNFYLAGEAQNWEDGEAGEAEYVGILSNIVLDGAIMQITFTIGQGGPRTQASRNDEHNFYVPTVDQFKRKIFNDPAQREAEKAKEVERELKPWQSIGEQNVPLL